ncbi:unnamed protein product [Lathyrus oleraceus]
MDDNQDRLKLKRVSQHVSVRRKEARLSQPPVSSSSVDAEAKISGVHASLTSSSRRRHVSPPDALEAPPVHAKAPQVVSFLRSFEEACTTYRCRRYIQTMLYDMCETER